MRLVFNDLEKGASQYTSSSGLAYGRNISDTGAAF